MLAQPVQRICKYPLFLRVRYTLHCSPHLPRYHVTGPNADPPPLCVCRMCVVCVCRVCVCVCVGIFGPFRVQELVKYTPETHEDYSQLTLAERKIGEVKAPCPPFSSSCRVLTRESCAYMYMYINVYIHFNVCRWSPTSIRARGKLRPATRWSRYTPILKPSRYVSRPAPSTNFV
jgi:hypothetical protein